jgi:hypothetical protein
MEEWKENKGKERKKKLWKSLCFKGPNRAPFLIMALGGRGNLFFDTRWHH